MKEEKQPFRSEKEAAEIIRCFEGTHRLFGYAVNGVSVWQILRFSIAIDLQNLPLKRASFARPMLFKHSLIGMIDAIKLITLGRRANYLISTCISLVRLRRGECYRDVFFDTLLSEVPGGIKMQFANARGYEFQQANAFIKPDFDSTLIYVISRVLARLFPVRNDHGVFYSVAQLIKKELCVTFYSEKVIRRVFSALCWQTRVYVLLLKLLKPHAIFAVGTGEYALLLACRNQGISFIELQHGIQTQDHPASLPSDALDYEKNLLLPDYMGVFGGYWKSLLADTAIAKKERIYIVGSDTIDYFRKIRSVSFVENPRNPVITLTTQGVDTDNVINFVREFLRVCDSKFTLNIKLHPAYDHSINMYVEAFAEDARCKVISGKNDPNSYELIACSDLHLSIASACHYDALGLGVPTVVIGLTGYQLMEGLVANGSALLAMVPDDLANIVKDRLWGAVPQEMSESYFKSGFLRNMIGLMSITV